MKTIVLPVGIFYAVVQDFMIRIQSCTANYPNLSIFSLYESGEEYAHELGKKSISFRSRQNLFDVADYMFDSICCVCSCTNDRTIIIGLPSARPVVRKALVSFARKKVEGRVVAWNLHLDQDDFFNILSLFMPQWVSESEDYCRKLYTSYIQRTTRDHLVFNEGFDDCIDLNLKEMAWSRQEVADLFNQTIRAY